MRGFNIVDDNVLTIDVEQKKQVDDLDEVKKGPFVTIGIPTYKRNDLLIRALNSINGQTYKNLVVHVSDNFYENKEISNLVFSTLKDISEVRVSRHKKNLGSLGNFRYLLDCCETEYFMWLADDDEISDNYVKLLIEALQDDKGAVSAMGQWILMRDSVSGCPKMRVNLNHESYFKRISSYLIKPNDAFFYGLHRTNLIKKPSFNGYCWPNNNSILNWCYPYLFDLVCEGRIVDVEKALFFNHDYGEKFYSGHDEVSNIFKNFFKFTTRRANIYAIYFKKMVNWKYYYLALFFLPLMFYLYLKDSIIFSLTVFKNICSK